VKKAKGAEGRRMEFSPPTKGLLAEKTPSSGIWDYIAKEIK